MRKKNLSKAGEIEISYAAQNQISYADLDFATFGDLISHKVLLFI